MTVDDKAREIALWNKACGLAEVFAAYFDESDDEEFRANATRDIFYALHDTERRVWLEAAEVAEKTVSMRSMSLSLQENCEGLRHDIATALRARAEKGE